jgi:hypothetical protein
MSAGFQPGPPSGEFFEKLFSEAAGLEMPMLVATFGLLGYAVLQLDRRRDGSPSRDDTQIGLKVALFAVLAASVLLAASGARSLLAFILGGFKGFSTMRSALATLVAGGGVAFATYALLLPRTNYQEKPAVERITLGMVGLVVGGRALLELDGFLKNLFAGSSWSDISSGLASVGVAGGVAALALIRLGSLSGWRAVPKVPPMPMQPPMTGQPMPPPAGMPPLGGGYPPNNSGGYPPQGGGWPGQ